MDSGPFSTPQPADRRAVNRPEQAYRPKDAQQPPVAEEPRAAHKSPAPHRGEGKRKRSFKWLIITVIVIVVIAIVGFGGWLLWSTRNVDGAINKSEYQAVFFTNGQVYLGKLAPYNSAYLKLTDAFIVVAPTNSQSDTVSQKDSANSNGTQLVKITNGVLAPHDAMFVARSQVLFYENLQPNGKAAKLIKQYNNQ